MNRIYLILFLLLCQAIGNAQNDTIPPDINCPLADTVTLGPGGDCTFQYFYTVLSSDNEPGDTLVQLSGLESGANFPIGTTVNLFQAIDAAGNTATCSFQLTVQNYAGPLTCKNNITISLDSTCAWIPGASDLLDGNAGCTDSGYYLLEVDKDAPYGNGPWLPAEFGLSDIGQTYIFRVSDTIFGYNCTGNIQINDQLPPTLTCADIAISCAVNNVSPYFLRDSLGIPAAVPLAMDGCGPVLLNHIDNTVDSGCTSGYVGVIRRTWTAQDDFGNSSTCMQQIFLTRPVISDLLYPLDVTVGCDADISSTSTGQPYLEFAGRKWTNTCSLGTAYSDSTLQSCPGSGQIIRRWFVIDWCNGDALEKVQTIDIQDTLGPFFLNCPDSTLVLGDTSTTNDPELWNAPHWANPPSGMENLCEGPVDLAIIATDNCAGINPGIRYLLFLDLDDNGTQETVVDSDNSPAAGRVNFGNAANPNYNGGEPRSFDERPVDSTLLYRFALQTIVSGDTITSRVVWNTDSIPGQYALPQLPHGTHKIRWTTKDSCGNEGVCEYEFVVKDVQPPTVVCADTILIANISPSGFYYLDIQYLFPTGTDNCTPPDSLLFGIRRAGAGSGFPVDAVGNPITGLLFECFVDFGEQQVELWAKDLAGNAGFCIVTIDVQDNSGSFCEPTLAVAGLVKTETNEGIKNVTVSLQSGTISIFDLTDDQGAFLFPSAPPPGSTYTVTPAKDDNPLNGVSTFDLVLISKHILGLEALGSPYKMIAADANRSNFITTFDIVELRKLILGIYDSLPDNTSWRFVDAGYVFPDSLNPFQPPFPESIMRNGVVVDQLQEDFIGIKVGDVNNTAIANDLLTTEDRTNLSPFGGGWGRTLFFNVKNRDVEAGEKFTVWFTSEEKVLGYQFTLNTNDLEVLEILPGTGMTAANFAVFPDAVTTSVDVPVTSVAESNAFAITFRSRKAGQLSDMLSISSRITKAEAYKEIKSNYSNYQNYLLNISLRFGDGGVTHTGFELYQNQPNPFSNKTLIGFQLPENIDVTLTIFDETGCVLFTQSGFYQGGYNDIVLEKAHFDHTGVLFYKLETATNCAVRKMVLVE